MILLRNKKTGNLFNPDRKKVGRFINGKNYNDWKRGIKYKKNKRLVNDKLITNVGSRLEYTRQADIEEARGDPYYSQLVRVVEAQKRAEDAKPVKRGTGLFRNPLNPNPELISVNDRARKHQKSGSYVTVRVKKAVYQSLLNSGWLSKRGKRNPYGSGQNKQNKKQVIEVPIRYKEQGEERTKIIKIPTKENTQYRNDKNNRRYKSWAANQILQAEKSIKAQARDVMVPQQNYNFSSGYSNYNSYQRPPPRPKTVTYYQYSNRPTQGQNIIREPINNNNNNSNNKPMEPIIQGIRPRSVFFGGP